MDAVVDEIEQDLAVRRLEIDRELADRRRRVLPVRGGEQLHGSRRRYPAHECARKLPVVFLEYIVDGGDCQRVELRIPHARVVDAHKTIRQCWQPPCLSTAPKDDCLGVRDGWVVKAVTVCPERIASGEVCAVDDDCAVGEYVDGVVENIGRDVRRCAENARFDDLCWSRIWSNDKVRSVEVGKNRR